MGDGGAEEDDVEILSSTLSLELSSAEYIFTESKSKKTRSEIRKEKGEESTIECQSG